MHLCVVLRDLDPAVRLALYEEQRQLELLVGMGDRLVYVQTTLIVIQQRVRDLDVALLQLSDRYLLFDELEEELLLVTNPFAHVKDFLLPLLHHFRRQSELFSLLRGRIAIGSIR